MGDVQLRPIRPDDAESCARIIYEAFCGIAHKHNFPVRKMALMSVGIPEARLPNLAKIAGTINSVGLLTIARSAHLDAQEDPCGK